MVSMERPRLSVRPISDPRFESLKTLLGVNDEMQQVMRGPECRGTSQRLEASEWYHPLVFDSKRMSWGRPFGVQGSRSGLMLIH